MPGAGEAAARRAARFGTVDYVDGTVTRLGWADLPGSLRSAAESALGAGVIADATQSGGFSPGLASRLVLADGRRVFAKAVSAARNPQSLDLYRREISVMRTLPAAAPAPQLQWSYDDGYWVMLVLDDVDGQMPIIPWRPDQLSLVLPALGHLAAALTPAPAGTTPIGMDLAGNFSSWCAIAGDPELAGRLGSWEAAHLADLVRLESGWAEGAQGGTLLHADLRADNLLLTAEGSVMVVDWPYAVAGAAWVDGLLFLISAAADGGTDPQREWSRYGPSQDADPAAVDTVLAAAAGDFTYQSLLPAPQNVPLLREHQRAKAVAAVAWLRARLMSR